MKRLDFRYNPVLCSLAGNCRGTPLHLFYDDYALFPSARSLMLWEVHPDPRPYGETLPPTLTIHFAQKAVTFSDFNAERWQTWRDGETARMKKFHARYGRYPDDALLTADFSVIFTYTTYPE